MVSPHPRETCAACKTQLALSQKAPVRVLLGSLTLGGADPVTKLELPTGFRAGG